MPHLLEGDFFHSLELFQILEKTPGIPPFMAVATQENKSLSFMGCSPTPLITWSYTELLTTSKVEACPNNFSV